MAPWIVVGALAFVAGCSPRITVTYDPRHFADLPIDPAKKIDGCVTILTTPEEDAFVWRGRPTTWTAHTTTLELPLGVMAREAAVRVFGDLFRGGAVSSAGASGATDACRVVVSPRATRFAWQAAAFASSTFDVTVSVEARSEGEGLLEKPYESGPFKVAPSQGYGGREAQARAAQARATQLVLQRLMLRAAADLRAELLRAAPPSGAP